MKYIAMCSFGKDSLATILLALKHKEPLDEVVFVEVMFDNERNISGEIPEHIEWIYNIAIPKLNKMGVKTLVLKSKNDYMYLFKKKRVKGKYTDKLYGFPIAGRCIINSELKIKPIKNYIRSIGEDVIEYIGVAVDEPKRLIRLNNKKISLLAKYGYTEQMAKELCEKNNLLSPIYSMSSRNGCWFCPNSKISSFSYLRKYHKNLWQELEKLSKTPNLCAYGFKYGKTFQQVNEMIDKYEKKNNVQQVLAFK